VNESFNPYLPPKANVDGADAPREIEPVSRWLRFGTFFIDYIAFFALSFGVGLVTGLAFGEAGVRVLQSIPDILLGLILMFSYYAFFEGIWARTPGKLVCGTIVVTQEGTKPSFGCIALRTVCRFIPFEPFSFFGERGWHDGISKTYVVSARG
jgi:uncharacterized RDD family membrane protein YckC